MSSALRISIWLPFPLYYYATLSITHWEVMLILRSRQTSQDVWYNEVSSGEAYLLMLRRNHHPWNLYTPLIFVLDHCVRGRGGASIVPRFKWNFHDIIKTQGLTYHYSVLLDLFCKFNSCLRFFVHSSMHKYFFSYAKCTHLFPDFVEVIFWH